MKKRTSLAIAITVILLIFILYNVDFGELIETLKQFRPKVLYTIVPLYLMTLYLRGIRWRALLLNDERYSSFHLSQVFTVGSMMNTFLPARAGDVYRAYYLGKVKQERKMKIFGSVILERLLDGIAVFLILLAALLLYSKTDFVIGLAKLVGGIFIGCFVLIYLIFKYNKIDYVAEKTINFLNKFQSSFTEKLVSGIKKSAGYLKSFISGFEVLSCGSCLFSALFLSMLIWGIESVIAYYAMNSLGLGVGISAGLFVTSLTSFSTVIPSSSVFLGPYQYAYIIALGIFGVDKTIALAASALHQSILMVILIVVGGICMFKLNISEKISE